LFFKRLYRKCCNNEQIFEMYLACNTLDEITEKTGIPKKTVDDWLKDLCESLAIKFSHKFNFQDDFQIPIYNVWKTQNKTKCQLSQFNPRVTRPRDTIEKLAQRIQRNGFEITRALWVYPVNNHFEVFAGGNRLQAAKMVDLQKVQKVVDI